VVDTQCGFKLFRGGVAQALFPQVTTDGFGFDVELLMLAERRGFRVVEVPVNGPISRVPRSACSARAAHDLRGADRAPRLARRGTGDRSA